MTRGDEDWAIQEAWTKNDEIENFSIKYDGGLFDEKTLSMPKPSKPYVSKTASLNQKIILSLLKMIQESGSDQKKNCEGKKKCKVYKPRPFINTRWG